MKNWTNSHLCMVVPFCSAETSIYRAKPKGGIPGRLGEQTLPQRTQDSRVSAALVWPGGHTQLTGSPDLVNFPYLLLVFLFLLQKLTKQPLIVWLQPLDSGRILLNRFSTSLICPDSLISNLF